MCCEATYSSGASVGFPRPNHFKVGKPDTPKRPPRSRCSSALTCKARCWQNETLKTAQYSTVRKATDVDTANVRWGLQRSQVECCTPDYLCTMLVPLLLAAGGVELMESPLAHDMALSA